MADSDIDHDAGLAIRELVDQGLLKPDTFEHGIAHQWAARGYDSLTENQRIVFDAVVLPLLKWRQEQFETQRIPDSNHD